MNKREHNDENMVPYIALNDEKIGAKPLLKSCIFAP